MPPFILLLLQLLPYLPMVIRTVEAIHPLPKSGGEKLKTAVSLLQIVAPEVVAHLQNEPANRTKLESLISTVVVGLNAANQLKGPTPPPAP
jgi:hypothetical protein